MPGKCWSGPGKKVSAIFLCPKQGNGLYLKEIKFLAYPGVSAFALLMVSGVLQAGIPQQLEKGVH